MKAKKGKKRVCYRPSENKALRGSKSLKPALKNRESTRTIKDTDLQV